MKIVGHTVGIPMPRTDYTQEDPTRSDYLKGRDELNRKLEEALQASQTATSGALSKTGGAMEGAIDMGGNALTGLPDPTAGDGAATKAYTDSQVRRASHKNLLDNGDFTQFVAQAGIGGKHGTQSYAGDRWILDSGTVTGSANADGNGYSNIKLSGTVRQKVASAPAAATAVIEMASGTASASYENGEVTVTSSGGVIKNVALYDGAYMADAFPAYTPKGYGVELAECQRYFCKSLEYAYGPLSSTQSYMAVPIPQKMRVIPTVTVNAHNEIRCGGNTIPVTNVTVFSMGDNVLQLLMTFASTSGVSGHAGIWRGVFTASADL